MRTCTTHHICDCLKARLAALEAEHQAALALCQRVEETETSDQPMVACVDRQNAAHEVWAAAVRAVEAPNA